jgi:cell division protein FtsL
VTPPAAAPAVQPRRVPTRPPAPSRPRRVSGPAHPARRPREQGGAARSAAALPAALGGLADHRLIDRLLTGKVWIAVVAFALIGIVTLQLGLLQLNRSIGRTLEREGVLQRENSALSIENSEMASGERVEAGASALGMELVQPGALRFLDSHPSSDVAHAAAALAAGRAAAATGESQSAGQSPASGETPAAAEGASSAGETSNGSGTGSSSAGSATGAGEAGAGEAPASRSSEPESGAAETPPAPAASPSASGGAGSGEAAAGGGQASPAG